jgi:hypothetical protein
MTSHNFCAQRMDRDIAVVHIYILLRSLLQYFTYNLEVVFQYAFVNYEGEGMCKDFF